RLAEQRVAREPTQELAVVVVEPEGEAHVLDAGLALGAHRDDAVRPLPGQHRLELAAGAPDRRPVDAAEDGPRRVAGEASGEAQRVRAARAQVGLEQPADSSGASGYQSARSAVLGSPCRFEATFAARS